ncbi:MAG: MFS transporter [Spirochaetales bacterium]|nr:MFS transporter [Spirochaetales bacterium]
MKKNIWLSIITIGLAGQIAWTVENMYFNVFLYNTISQDPGYIAMMVALSAITATFTTLFMGTVSDRVGRRKPFMTWGYVIWALTVAAFAFVSPESMKSITVAAVAVVALDCIMTFFGSTANDAVFNAYVTESVEEEKRTKVESVVQIMPMAAMLLVFGVLDGFTQKGEWKTFFLITAAIMMIAGILSFLFVKDERRERKKDEKFLSNLIYGFLPSTIKENKGLYLSLLAFGVNAIGMQVFYPYLIIYIQNYLGFDNYVILLGVVLVVSSILCVLIGKLIDKVGRIKSSFPSVVLMAIGMLLMFFSRSFIVTTISGTIMMTGYLISTSVLSSLVRDYTPKGKEGEIQGVRMIFQVMIPMIVGPYLGAAAIKNSNLTYTELGVVKSVPTPLVFLIASAITILSIIPLLLLKRSEAKR